MSEESGSRDRLLSRGREATPSDFLSRLERSAQGAYRGQARARRARPIVLGTCVGLVALVSLIWTLQVPDGPAITAEKVRPSSARSGPRKVTTGAEPVQETKAPPVVEIPGPDHSRRTAAPSAKPRPPALSREVRVLAEVRRALESGHPKQALLQLDQHGGELRAGQLRLEAEVLRLEAMSRLGQKREASERAQRFIDQNPHSPLADRVRGYVRR